MPNRIVVTGQTLTGQAVERLEQNSFVVDRAPGDLDENALIDRLNGAWGYILGGSELATARVLRESRGLTALCFLGTGYQSFLDAHAGRELGIQLAYTPYANVRAVAELTMGLMISLVRGIPDLSAATKRGQ